MLRNVSRLLQRASPRPSMSMINPTSFKRVMGTYPLRTFGQDNFASGANANYIDHMYA